MNTTRRILNTLKNQAPLFCVLFCVFQSTTSFELFYWKQLWLNDSNSKWITLKKQKLMTRCLIALSHGMNSGHWLLAHTHTHAHKYLCSQRQMWATNTEVGTGLHYSDHGLQRKRPSWQTTTATTVRLITVMVWGCVQKPENENRMSKKGECGNVVAKCSSFWCVRCNLLMSLDLRARTWQLRFCKQNSHYAHYVCLKQQQDTLRWHSGVH